MALPYWLAGQIPREQTYTGDADYFQRLNVTPLLGQRVDKIDPSAKTLRLSNGDEQSFDDLLIATGSSPIPLSIPGIDLPGVQRLWTLSDTENALSTVDGKTKPRVTLVGAGFIGCIVLNAMFKRNWNLTVVERDQHVLPRMLNERAAAHVERWLEKNGIGLHVGTSLQEITEAGDGSKKLKLENGESVDADLVIVATGVQPNIGLAKDAGLETDHGIVINNYMQTNVPDIYAAETSRRGRRCLVIPKKFTRFKQRPLIMVALQVQTWRVSRSVIPVVC